MAPTTPNVTGPDAPILDEPEAQRRSLLLTELQDVLSALGVRSVRARRQRLVLRYNESPLAPSGPTGPTLHVFGPSGARIVSTDCNSYRLDDGQEFPVSDPATVAAVIRSR